MGTRTIRIRAVFNPNDRDSVTVLQLVAAANDLSTVARLLPGTRGVPEETNAQQQVAGAERRYLMRMAALHLNEIVDLVNHQDLDRAVDRCARRGGPYEKLPAMRDALRRRLNAGPLRKVLGLIRNGFAGHYKRAVFSRSLTLLDDTDLMDMPVPPTTAIHFNVTDRLFDAAFVEESHAGYRGDDAERSAEAAMTALSSVPSDVMDLAIALTHAMYEEALSR